MKSGASATDAYFKITRCSRYMQTTIFRMVQRFPILREWIAPHTTIMRNINWPDYQKHFCSNKLCYHFCVSFLSGKTLQRWTPLPWLPQQINSVSVQQIAQKERFYFQSWYASILNSYFYKMLVTYFKAGELSVKRSLIQKATITQWKF